MHHEPYILGPSDPGRYNVKDLPDGDTTVVMVRQPALIIDTLLPTNSSPIIEKMDVLVASDAWHNPPAPSEHDDKDASQRQSTSHATPDDNDYDKHGGESSERHAAANDSHQEYTPPARDSRAPDASDEPDTPNAPRRSRRLAQVQRRSL
jgi:hypothetical protein